MFFDMTLCQGAYNTNMVREIEINDIYQRAHHDDVTKVVNLFIRPERFNRMTQFIINVGVWCNKVIRNYRE